MTMFRLPHDHALSSLEAGATLPFRLGFSTWPHEAWESSQAHLLSLDHPGIWTLAHSFEPELRLIPGMTSPSKFKAFQQEEKTDQHYLEALIAEEQMKVAWNMGGISAVAAPKRRF